MRQELQGTFILKSTPGPALELLSSFPLRFQTYTHSQCFFPTMYREQDRYLPIANISRIMKRNLPANAKIAKDAKDTVQECVSEFISFITSEASDKCQREKRKTINGEDLLWAMGRLDFHEYLEPLKVYLGKFRESEKHAVGSTAKGSVGQSNGGS